MPTPSPAPLNEANLAEWLAKLTRGEATAAEVLSQIMRSRGQSNMAPDAIATVEGATVDVGRQSRCGFGEVIYGQGKDAALISRIARTQIDQGQTVLVTRIDQETTAQVQRDFAHTVHNPIARSLRVASHPIDPATSISESQAQQTTHVAVLTAGSTDIPVSEEAMETLTWMEIPFQRFDDIGVAGPQRLLAVVPRLRLASAVIVVAGMEGALPSAVAGHLSTPIFAVPTSVGYGATLGGLTPLLGMLSSCAASVAVVNIDAGFKGGYLAGLVVSQLRNLHSQETDHA